MPYAGQYLANPATGETFTFVKTAADTNGALVELDATCPPGTAPPAPHVHPLQDESFTVQAGRVRVELAGASREIGPGETVTVPKGIVHTWSAIGDEPARMTVTLAPALSTDVFFEQLFGLAMAGKVNAKGMPSPLRMMVLLDDHRGTLYLASPPVAVQRLAARLLAPVGRLLGASAPSASARTFAGDVGRRSSRSRRAPRTPG